MHILFLTDNFPPEVNAPASRTFEHAKHWVMLGHKVTVITCAPNFPDGKVFLGYKNHIWQSGLAWSGAPEQGEKVSVRIRLSFRLVQTFSDRRIQIWSIFLVL